MRAPRREVAINHAQHIFGQLELDRAFALQIVFDQHQIGTAISELLLLQGDGTVNQLQAIDGLQAERTFDGPALN